LITFSLQHEYEFASTGELLAIDPGAAAAKNISL